MSEESETPPVLEPEVPESWSQHRPVPRAKNISSFRASILIGSLVAAIVFGIWAVMRIDREPTGPTAKTLIQPRVRWEYHTESIKPEESALRDDDTKSSTEKYVAALKDRNRFYFLGRNLDELGEAGWELVGVVPNTETVFTWEDPGKARLPNTRLAEIILLFKRPSLYEPRTDEQIRETQERMRKYERERAAKK